MTALELAIGPMADALWRIVVFGLLIGAGLPAVFAVGLRLLSPSVAPSGPDAAQAPVVALVHPSRLRRLAAWCCFGVVAAAIVAGIGLLVAGGH